MTKTNVRLKKLAILLFAIMLPIAVIGLLPCMTQISTKAFVDQYEEIVSISNSSFNGISTTYSEGDVTGWTRKWKNTGAKTMIIDTAESFSTYASNTYFLKDTPGKQGADNKVLMINSASSFPYSASFVSQERSEGYISNSISLAANSFYEFHVSIKTSSFNDAQEFGSIYISGLVDSEGNEVPLKVERISTSMWQTYYFFIETGAQSQNVTIDLWLGTQEFASAGVVFFDEVYGKQLSENAYFELLARQQAAGKNIEKVALDKGDVISNDLNFDFEKSLAESVNGLVDWKIENSSVNAHARILNLNDGNFENVTGFTYPGKDLTVKNTQGMVLWANEGYVSAKSLPFEIKAHGLYKITMHVKTSDLTSGAFTVQLAETDKIKNEFAYLTSYTLGSSTSSEITSNGSNKFINDYSEVVFYAQGHDRYDSEVTLSLMLGSQTTNAVGAVVIDNIEIERVKFADFKTDGNLLKLSVASDESESIANGQFNRAENSQSTLTYPIKAADWTTSKSNSQGTKKSGIINIYAPYFNSYNLDFANPGSPNSLGSTSDVNNIYMMQNVQEDYQSITSKTFTVEAGSYKKLSFRFKTAGGNASFNVKLIDENNILLIDDKNISSADWADYQLIVNAGEVTSTVKLEIEFGSKTNPVSGFAFFDYVELSDSSKEEFDAAGTTVDLSGFMLNLDPNNEISSNLSSSPAFSGKVEAGALSSANGGITKGQGNDSFYFINDDGRPTSIDDGSLSTNVLVISTSTASTYTLSSNFKLKTEASKYYALKFRLLTSFPSYDDSHKDHKATYGVKVGIDGFDLIENLTSNEGWTEFTIYFNSTEAKDANFVMSLVSDCLQTSGYAYLTDISWEESSADVFNAAANKEGFNKTIFVSNIAQAETPDEPTDEPSTTAPEADFNWLLIPSLIFGAAVIIALVGFMLRHVKVKKIDKKRKEEYDREMSLQEDALLLHAKEVQSEQITQINSEISKCESEIAELEERNKQTIAKSREEGKVTVEVEREFKSFAQKRTKAQKKLDQLKEELAFVETADYLLSIQRRLAAEKKKELTQTEKAKKSKSKNPDSEK